jgi:hypothetical protein
MRDLERALVNLHDVVIRVVGIERLGPRRRGWRELHPLARGADTRAGVVDLGVRVFEIVLGEVEVDGGLTQEIKPLTDDLGALLRGVSEDMHGVVVEVLDLERILKAKGLQEASEEDEREVVGVFGDVVEGVDGVYEEVEKLTLAVWLAEDTEEELGDEEGVDVLLGVPRKRRDREKEPGLVDETHARSAYLAARPARIENDFEGSEGEGEPRRDGVAPGTLAVGRG